MQTLVYTPSQLLASGKEGLDDGPLAARLAQLDEDDTLIVCVEDENQILAYWPIWRTVHVDGLWVAEDARKTPAVLRALLAGVSATLRQNSIGRHFAVLETPEMEAMAERLGYTKVPGALYLSEEPT